MVQTATIPMTECSAAYSASFCTAMQSNCLTIECVAQQSSFLTQHDLPDSVQLMIVYIYIPNIRHFLLLR